MSLVKFVQTEDRGVATIFTQDVKKNQVIITDSVILRVNKHSPLGAFSKLYREGDLYEYLIPRWSIAALNDIASRDPEDPVRKEYLTFSYPTEDDDPCRWHDIYQFIMMRLPDTKPYVSIDLAIRILLTFTVNCIGEGDDDETAGLWRHVSRLNHDCTPNVRPHYTTKGMQIKALTDMPAGKEALMTYLPTAFNGKKGLFRRAIYLRRAYSFECSCQKCALEAAQLAMDPQSCPIGSWQATSSDALSLFQLLVELRNVLMLSIENVDWRRFGAVPSSSLEIEVATRVLSEGIRLMQLAQSCGFQIPLSVYQGVTYETKALQTILFTRGRDFSAIRDIDTAGHILPSLVTILAHFADRETPATPKLRRIAARAIKTCELFANDPPGALDAALDLEERVERML